MPAGNDAETPPVSPSANVNVPVLAADQPPATIAVAVSCGYASDNGEAPNLLDNHNVWNNAATDGSFGVSSPIRLDDLTTDGKLIGTLRVPSHEIVTSFSSKSELALNRSVDGKTLTFMGYRGGPGCPTLTLSGSGKTLTLTQGTNVGPISPTASNLIDVSASSTPGLCDPTNSAVSSYVGASGPTAYYRSVAEVDPWGHIFYTDNNAYSGDNSRAVMKGDNWLYYSAGNDNSGEPVEVTSGNHATGLRSLPFHGRRTHHSRPGAARSPRQQHARVFRCRQGQAWQGYQLPRPHDLSTIRSTSPRAAAATA